MASRTVYTRFRCLLIAVIYCLYTQCLILKIFAQSPGDISPRIVIGVGENANITCRMNLRMFDGANSSSLYFTTDNPNHQATHANVVILDSTTIVYQIRNAREQYSIYTCKSGQYAIGNTDVIVGTKPTKVRDFTCQAYDFIYMICSFTIPANTIPTTYNLKYVTQNARRTADNRKIYSQNYILNCTRLIKEGNRAMCNFTLDDGSYKPNFEYYNFRLTSNNTLGALSQNFTINHKEIVKPAITEFRITNISTHGCVLTWQMERYASYKLNRLQMKVHLQSPHYEHTKTYICIKCNDHAIFHLSITDLPYAYYQYNVSLRIKMRMSAATWSDAYSATFQTHPAMPESSPAVDRSGFYLNATHARLFWSPTPDYHRNGSHFHYIVQQVLKDGVAIVQPSLHTQTPTIALPWESMHSYEFKIWSSNELGVSPFASRLSIPMLEEEKAENRTPFDIRNVYHAAERAYTLLWSAPIDFRNLVDYTVFWCKPKSVVSNDCRNIIGFAHLRKYAQNFTIQQSQPLVLAIAANYPDIYTGMHWAKCTADASNDLEKLELEILEKRAYSIMVRWSAERVCASLIKGYTLVYCKIRSLTKLKCVDENVKINIDKSDNKYEIMELEPNTAYKMEMYMYSDVQSGPVSDALTMQTSEAAPMPPRDLSYAHVTSQSVLLTWIMPLKANGQIRSYIISYNRESLVVTCNNKNDGANCFSIGKKGGGSGGAADERLSYTLMNLSSFTNYTICIKAYTVAESLPSNYVTIQTLIGVPSSPAQANFVDSKDLIIRWQQPEVPSGRVDYYEIIVETKYKDHIEGRHISRITNAQMLCTLRKPICDNNDLIYAIGVRAVNVALPHEIDPQLVHIYNNSRDNNENYIAASAHNGWGCSEAADQALLFDWQKNRREINFIEYRSAEAVVLNYDCSALIKSDGKIWLTIFLIILGTSIFVIGGLLIFKRCHEMASINCKIPDPLNDLVNRNDNIEPLKEQRHDDDADDDCLRPIKIRQKYSHANENGRLLACISKETDYMNVAGSGVGGGVGDGVSDVGCAENSWPNTTQSTYYASTDATTVDYCPQDPITVGVGYVVMTAPKKSLNDLKNEPDKCDLEKRKNSVNKMLSYTQMDNGYVLPNALAPASTKASEKPPFTINWPLEAEDGYILNSNHRHTFNW